MITERNLEIRKINIDEAVLLRNVATRAYSDHYLNLWYDEGKWYKEKSFSLINLRRELENNNAWFFIIYYDKEAVGFLKLNIDAPLPNDENTNALELERIYLTKTATGKGIGKYILDFIFKIAKEKNKKNVWLKVMDSSASAISFYKKAGFEICGTARLDFEAMKEEFRGMLIMKRLM
jgi:ribosomal protein S18 acetylase RimI-like enzyme